MEKTKPGSKGKLRRKPTFDFVSPRSLEECIGVLQVTVDRRTFRSNTLRVQQQMIDDDTAIITLWWSSPNHWLKRSEYRNVILSAHLKRWEGTSTYVTGKAFITRTRLLISLTGIERPMMDVIFFTSLRVVTSVENRPIIWLLALLVWFGIFLYDYFLLNALRLTLVEMTQDFLGAESSLGENNLEKPYSLMDGNNDLP